MRRLLALSALCLLLATTSLATTAHAGTGVNLRWSNCFGDGGTSNRNFACDSNAGSNVLVSSFVLEAPIPQATGNEVVIDLATSSAAIPPWWELRNAGSCRQTSLGANTTPPGTAVNCVDWANGQALGVISAYTVQPFDPNVVRITMALSSPPMDLVAGQESFSNNLVINNAKTVGTGACGGCDVGVCLIFHSMWVRTPTPANDRLLSGPTNGTDSFYVTWQGGGTPTTRLGTGCPRATPTRQETWGAVKALYR